MPVKRMKRPPLHDPSPQPPQSERQQIPVASQGAASARKGRGPSKTRKFALEANRPKLTVVGDAEFDAQPDGGRVNQVKATIREIVLSRLEQPYPTYFHYDKDLRDKCLNEFLECYNWADGHDPNRCRQVFNNIANDRFSDSISKARKNCMNKYGRDIDKWKDLPPIWCKNTKVWALLCDEWKTPEWQEEVNLGKKPSYEDIFVRTKVLPPNENGERHFVDAKSKKVLDSYREKRIEKRGDDPSTYPPTADLEDLDLFLQIAGGYSHGKLYAINKLINTEVIPIDPRKRKRVQCDMATASVPPTVTSSSGEREFFTRSEVRELLDQQARQNSENERRTTIWLQTLYDHFGLVPPTIPPADGLEKNSAQPIIDPSDEDAHEERADDPDYEAEE